MTAYPPAIWYTRCPVPTPLGIAINLGSLDRALAPHGVAINSLQETNDPKIRASHIDHHLPHSFRQGGSIPAIWARAAGADTRVIGLSWVDESQAIITLPKSGIRTIGDLKGRRIGLPMRHGQKIDIFRATALRAILAGLSLGGVGEDEVEWVDIDATDPVSNVGPAAQRGWGGRALYAAEFGALVRGDVDAIHVKGSLGAEYILLGDAHVVVDTGFHPDPKIRVNNGAPRPLTVDAATLDHFPLLAETLLANVIAAGDWAERHPAETLAYISAETGSSEQFVRAAYGGDTLHQQLRTDLSAASSEALGEFTDFLFDRGFIPERFDVADWIDRRPWDALQARTREAA